MTPVRVLSREEWEAKLRNLDCSPWPGDNPVKTVEVWETKNKRLFFVPMDNGEGRLRDDDLNTIIVQITKLRPGTITDT
jgi:hypothetical protein